MQRTDSSQALLTDSHPGSLWPQPGRHSISLSKAATRVFRRHGWKAKEPYTFLDLVPDGQSPNAADTSSEPSSSTTAPLDKGGERVGIPCVEHEARDTLCTAVMVHMPAESCVAWLFCVATAES